LDYYLNKPGAGAASVNQAFSNATMAIFPLNGGEVFPGNITANTIQLMLSGNVTATASSSSNTQSYSIGFYTMNASTLSLAFSASSSFAVGAATLPDNISCMVLAVILHGNTSPPFKGKIAIVALEKA
jgi:hypothetical protein